MVAEKAWVGPKYGQYGLKNLASISKVIARGEKIAGIPNRAPEFASPVDPCVAFWQPSPAE
jgi:hypothetical protein